YQPASPAGEGGAPASGRQRVGTHLLTVPGTDATAKVIAYRHRDGAVTAGMGEAALNALTPGLEADGMRTLRAGIIALNARVSASEAEMAGALAWQLRAARVLLEVTQGACIDPVAQRAFGRSGLAKLAPDNPASHVAVSNELWSGESRWLH